jgi:outer membrane protein
MKKFALSAFAALMMLLSAGTDAQAQKVGVIDSRQVLEAYPEYIAAVNRIQGIQKLWEDSLTMMSTQFKTKLETYQSVLDQLSPEKKKSAEAELGALQETAQKFQQAKFGQNGELAQQQQQIAAPLFEKVRALVAQYAKREKYTMILDKSAAIYVDAGNDVTDKVAAFVKTGGK